jgi:hypothetical protein
MKENKYFSQVSFWLPFGYVFALGLFFTEDSRFTKVLHRDQTDEWKGEEVSFGDSPLFCLTDMQNDITATSLDCTHIHCLIALPFIHSFIHSFLCQFTHPG